MTRGFFYSKKGVSLKKTLGMTQVILETLMAALSWDRGEAIDCPIGCNIVWAMGTDPVEPHSGLPTQGQPHATQVINSLKIHTHLLIGQKGFFAPQGMHCAAGTQEDAEDSKVI
jgi:hypothetical protein